MSKNDYLLSTLDQRPYVDTIVSARTLKGACGSRILEATVELFSMGQDLAHKISSLVRFLFIMATWYR